MKVYTFYPSSLQKIFEYLRMRFVFDFPCSTIRHCESKLNVCLGPTKSIVATSTKQSPLTEFVAKSMKGDCFVARPLRGAEKCALTCSHFFYAPRNDEVSRSVPFSSEMTRRFSRSQHG
jgi:hypothetical protein